MLSEPSNCFTKSLNGILPWPPANEEYSNMTPSEKKIVMTKKEIIRIQKE